MKRIDRVELILHALEQVAFTPKGGCPLKLESPPPPAQRLTGSIHPQGWVPIETVLLACFRHTLKNL